MARCWDCHGRHNVKPSTDPESMVNRRNVPLTCSRCHEDMHVVVKYNIHAESPYQEYRKSVHGRGLYDKGLLDFAAVCTDCHGVHNIQGVGTVHLPAKDPATCGKCHRLVLEEYSRSIHGREALKGNADVPLCVDCHGEHTVAAAASTQAPTSKAHVPDTCSACHARPEIMRKYGVPEDRIKTFIESFHGIAIGLGGTAEASCVDCHGVHDIRPAADPESKVFPANLAKTCGQASCHADMTPKIAGTKIHRDYSQAKSGAPFYVKKFLVWAVFILTALTLVFFIPAIIRRRRGFKTR
ncbi:MAG: NapC/NirT family cytochrome c [Candidatus Aminicenantes bacterium]|nr:NapC/NirT family cytochrome c [Candidatus Aminicenantes bacterium]